MRAANKESASSDSSSSGSLEDGAGDDMVQRYIPEFSMTTVEGGLMYKLEKKTILQDRRRNPKIICLLLSFMMLRSSLRTHVNEVDDNRCAERFNETFDSCSSHTYIRLH